MAQVHNDVSLTTFTDILQQNKWTTEYIVDNHLLTYQYTDWKIPKNNTARSQKLNELYSDSAFNAPAVRLADIILKTSIPTFFYHMTKQAFNNTVSGVHHYDGVRGLFGKRSSDGDGSAVMERAFDMWINFIKSG